MSFICISLKTRQQCICVYVPKKVFNIGDVLQFCPSQLCKLNWMKRLIVLIIMIIIFDQWVL